ncbi:branched-chain amino acid ABC transporter permease [Labrys wisconsinensis]|uniref:Branched-chain amino acid transport system permease protein n=1 Tax=Labrys wisconsinensis TaxID=425677 RepID=A0ABU0JBC8_9HYPH|nr:branched-chain amino acid ABC transporter permease [Labrys wisconsinensis]MDQ0471574.1 branched-chain amino acid transport system permease protein [Labrys wisconsinensis]
MPRPLLLLAALILALALTACGMVLDGDQVRVCRQTLPAVNPDATAITVLRVDPAPAPYAVRLAYRVEQGGIEQDRFVLCGFAAEGIDLDRNVLARFATEEGPYSPIKLHILNRYWLEKTALATAADPGPGLAAPPLIVASTGIAYLVQALANALPSTAMMMLIAVAYALIYGLVGRINLAFGELAALGAYGAVIGAVLATQAGFTSVISGLFAAAALGIGMSVLHGLAIERLVFTPLAFGRGQSILVATLALAIVLQDYMRLTQGAENRWIPPLLTAALPLAGSPDFTATVTPMQLIVAGFTTVLALALVLLMRLSGFGRRWRATADDAGMAGLMGISPKAMLGQTFMLATGLAGAAGFIMTVYYGGAGFAAGTMIGLKALVAAVVGGIGSIGGALLGGLAIGLFEAFWSAYLPIEHRDLAVLSLLSIVLTLRPGGIFGLGDDRPRQV